MALRALAAAVGIVILIFLRHVPTEVIRPVRGAVTIGHFVQQFFYICTFKTTRREREYKVLLPKRLISLFDIFNRQRRSLSEPCGFRLYVL